MRLGVDFNILNQKGTPAFYSDIFANRPNYGFAGRVFISTDTGAIYEDTGTAWTLIADAGAGTTGTLQQVTTNGNTTTQGIVISANGLNTNSININAQSLSSKLSYISQVMATNDFWKIYGYATTLDQGEMVFEIGDNGSPFASNGERFRFSYNADSSGSVKDVLIVDYNESTFNTALTADSFTSSALTVGSVLFAGTGGTISQKNSNLFWDNTNNRLGIGNAAPGAPLDVHGTGTNAQFNGTGTNNAYLQFQNAGTSKWRIGNTYNAGANSFDIYSNSSAITVMSITNSGKILVNNTTDQGGQFQVTGDIRSYGTSAAIYFQNRATSDLFGWIGNTNVYLFNAAVGGNIASINAITGVYTPLSDINKKKDIEDSTLGLEAILNLKPTLFRMINEEATSNKHLGFIAQQVKDFIPQAYVEQEDFIGLNDRPIIAVLVKAIQELNNKLVKNNIN